MVVAGFYSRHKPVFSQKGGNYTASLLDLFVSISVEDNASSKIQQISKNVSQISKAFEAASKQGGGGLDDLNKKVQEASDRIKESSEQAKKASERIKESTKRAKEASEQVKEASKNIKDIPNAGKDIGEKVSQGAKKGSEAIKNMGKTGKEQAGILESAFSRVGSALAAAFTVKKLFDFGVSAVTTAADAQTSFAKVQTLLSSGTDINAYFESVRKGSREAGIPLAEYTEALYQSLSASVEQGKAVQFTTQAAKLARGGFTDLATAVDVLTTIQNAYGLSASQTSRIADKLITTQNLGKVNVAQLAAVMGRSIPVAKSYNVSLETLFASYAALTKNGNPAAETTTLLNAAFNEMGKYSTKTAQILRDKTGKSFSELMASGESLTDVLGILQEAATRTGLSLADLFGSAEAARGANLILSNANDITTAINAMGNSMGASAEANATMLNTYNEQVKQLKTNWGLLMEEVGRRALPGLNKVVGQFTKVLTGEAYKEHTYGIFEGTAETIEEATAKAEHYKKIMDDLNDYYSGDNAGMIWSQQDIKAYNNAKLYYDGFMAIAAQLVEANNEIGESTKSTTDLIKAQTDDYISSAQALLDQYQATYDATLSSLEQFFSPFEKVSINVKTSLNDMIDGMKSQIDYFQTYNQNVQTLTEAGLGSFSEMLIGMGPTGAAYAQAIVDAMTQAGGATSEQTQTMVQDLLELQNTLEESREGLSGSVSEAMNGTSEKIAELSQTFVENVAQWDKSEEAITNARNTITAFASGLTESQGKIMEAAGNIGQLITSAIQANVGTIQIGVELSLPTGGSIGSSFSVSGGKPKGHAIGLDFVPYNGYLAALHRGEAILTSYEADQWRRGRSDGENKGTTIIQNIQSVPQTPVQLAEATAAYFAQARWL